MNYNNAPERSNKRPFIAAFIASFSILFLEIALFQQLQTLMSYMAATMVVSIALLGIALGGLLAFAAASRAASLLPIGLGLIGPAALVAFFVSTQYHSSDLIVALALCPPFLAGAFTVSLAFALAKKTGHIYAADLAGAGIGALAAAIAIPLIREEGAILSAASLAMLAPLAVIPKDAGIKFRKGISALFVLLFAGGVALTTVHFSTEAFNLIRFAAKGDKGVTSEKIFNNPERIGSVSSHGSLIERIDVFFLKKRKRFLVAYNGIANDKITSTREHQHELDRRVPVRPLVNRLDSPQVLVIGASAEGINKTAKLIAGDGGRVIGLEYNEAIPKAVLERHPSYHATGRYWYSGMELHSQDARTFLSRSDEEYDLITMLNTHKVRSIGVEGPPEYLHTTEAVESYLDHLSPEGALLIEERNLNAECNAGIHNYLVTISDALRNKGLDPSRHILMYEYYADRRSTKALSRNKIKPRTERYAINRYAIILVFKSPIDDDEELAGDWDEWKKVIDFFNVARRDCTGAKSCLAPIKKSCRKEWARYFSQMEEWGCVAETAREEGCRCGFKTAYSDIRPRHLPWAKAGSTFTKAITQEDPSSLLAKEGFTLTVATNDRPFIQDVDLEQPAVDEILEIVSVACGLLVVLPLAVIGIRLWRSGEKGATGGRSKRTVLTDLALMGLIASMVGLAYLFIEVVLIQWFSIFMGSPAASLSVILPSMLVFSGIGGIISQRISGKGLTIATAVVVVFAVLFNQILNPLLGGIVGLPYALRIGVSVLIMAPLFIAMGVPFSFVLKSAYARFTPAYPAAFFAVNGACGALATPLGVKISMVHGYGATMRVGAALYALVLLLSFLLARVIREKKT